MRADRSLAAELAASGAFSRDREKELETAADRALAQAAGNAQKAIAANGGLGVLSPPGGDLFIDDEATVMRTPAKSGSLGDDDEATRMAPVKVPLDEDDEPTKVLDWDRATRKSIENAGTPQPPRKK